MNAVSAIDTSAAIERAAAAAAGELPLPVLRDAMIDVETLGTKPGCAILTIGATMFGPSGLGTPFYAPILLTSCVDVGLAIDPATVGWWMTQSVEAREAAFCPNAAPLAVVLRAFSQWFVDRRAVHPWCHGATFDVPVLDAAYRACGMTPPWDFWDVRDTRTLYELAGVKVDRSQGTHHNALVDAINQAEAAAQAMRILRARADASAMTPDLLGEIAEAFKAEADRDTALRDSMERMTAFDYFKRGWLGNGTAVNIRLASTAAA